jgi:hypothetical protein
MTYSKFVVLKSLKTTDLYAQVELLGESVLITFFTSEPISYDKNLHEKFMITHAMAMNSETADYSILNTILCPEPVYLDLLDEWDIFSQMCQKIR